MSSLATEAAVYVEMIFFYAQEWIISVSLDFSNQWYKDFRFRTNTMQGSTPALVHLLDKELLLPLYLIANKSILTQHYISTQKIDPLTISENVNIIPHSL